MEARPRSTQRSWTPDMRIAAVSGAVYFIAYLVFSLCFLRERFMVDGGYMIFEMANTRTYPMAQNRYIIWVLNILPVSAVNIGLPLKTVMVSWVVNYVIFYAAAFYVVLLVFKDRYSAWLLLFINLFVLGTGFFNIADEITPSATMAIVLFSMWNHYKGWPDPKLFPIVALMLFFTVFGHLLVPVALLMVAAYYLVNAPGERKILKDRFLLPAIIFACLLIMRYTSGLEDSYEREHMAITPAHIIEQLATLSPSFAGEYGIFYVKVFSVICILLVVAVIYMVFKREWMRLWTFFLLAMGYFTIWYITIYGRFGEVMLSQWFNVPIRWLFPLNFLVLFVFFERARFFLPKNTWVLPVVFLLGSTYQFAMLGQLARFPTKTLEQFDALSAQFTPDGHSKYYMDDANKCPFGKYHSVYTNSIVFTAMEGPEAARQFVLATEDELGLVLETPVEILYLTDDLDFAISDLNPTYFDMEVGVYKKMDADFSDCPYRR